MKTSIIISTILALVFATFTLPLVCNAQATVISDKTEKIRIIKELCQHPIHPSHFKRVSEKLGIDAIDLISEEIQQTQSIEEKTNLIIMLRYYNENAQNHAPQIREIIEESMGKELSNNQFRCLLVSLDTLAQISNDREDLFNFATEILYEDYWKTRKPPTVNEPSYKEDTSLVKTRIKKKACNILAWIGGNDASMILKDLSNHEKSLGNSQLAYVLAKSAEIIDEHGSLKEYLKDIID
ncbi:MAG: hypothetical protein GC154_21000 [bacterium]|nr:hypothetical protein [bacterium]